MVMNKKGSELTLSTIIIIVLGIAVLVFLIFGFSTGWTNLWSKITGYVGTSNVDDIKSACTVACSQNAVNNYCVTTRTVKYGQKMLAWNGTAMNNETQSSGTCQSLTDTEKYPNARIAPCPEITCP